MKFIFGNLVLAGCLLAGYLFYRDTAAALENETDKTGQKSNIAVEVVTLSSSSLREWTELTGSLQAESRILLRSRLSAYIRDIPFDIGDQVEAGQVVVQLDDLHHQELLSSAMASLRVAEAQLRSQEETLNQAETDVRRLGTLRDSGVSTRQQSEQALSKRKIARAEVDLASARLEEARSKQQSAKLALQETQITCPIDGIVAERFSAVGDLAHPDEVLLTVVDLSKVRILVHVVERDYSRIEIGQAAEVRVDAISNQIFRGVIRRKAPVIDDATKTAVVQIEIDNPSGVLRPGMHARVSIIIKDLPQAMALPIAALVERENEAVVFVLDANGRTVCEKKVDHGIRDRGLVEIKSGLNPGDLIVTLGSHLLEDGQEVEAVSAPSDQIGTFDRQPQSPAGPYAGE